MKKYDAKYFGIATGISSVIIFLLAIIQMLFFSENVTDYIKPFIPFFNDLTVLNTIGGVVVSFLWGWVLGYFFIILYNWIDKRLVKSVN